MSKQAFLVCGILIVLIGIAAYFPCFVFVPSNSDWEEARSLHEKLIESYDFRDKDEETGEPPVYAAAFYKYSRITIYGNYSPEERQEIAEMTRTIVEAEQTKPVRLSFFENRINQDSLLEEITVK